MSRSTALTLFEASVQIPLFHLEDIYVTGILSEQVEFINLSHKKLYFHYSFEVVVKSCVKEPKTMEEGVKIEILK